MGSEIERYEESGQGEAEELDDLEEEIFTKGNWSIEKTSKSQEARGSNNTRPKEEKEEAEGLARETERLKNQFFNRHKSILMSSNSDGSTVFHILAARAKDRFARKLESLVYWTVEIAGKKLADVDHEQRTPFHIAIQNKNYRVLRYMLNAHEQFKNEDGLSRWSLDDILTIQDKPNRNTVVHLAIEKMTPCGPKSESPNIQLVSDLVENASKTTLCKRNSSNLTALHLAVEGKRCNPQQVDLVKSLIERCEKALDLYDDTGNSVPSVYRRHWATFQEWEKATVNQHRSGNANTPRQGIIKSREGLDKIMMMEETTKGAQDKCIADYGGLDRDATSRREPSPDNSRLQSRNPTTDNIPNDEYNDLEKPKSEFTSVTNPITLRKRHSSRRLSQVQPKMPTRPLRASNSEILADKESAQRIAGYLKHTFLRTKNRRNAFLFLYGAVKENWKQIDFNLEGKEGEIEEADFKAGYKCANLEDILKLVHIPHLVIKPKPPPEQPTVAQTDDQHNPIKPLNSSLGRTDLRIIFNWLREEAQVKKIIELIVEDSHSPPHTDSQIEESVSPFDVEIWNWHKVDLCAETIAKAAPNVREVNLYWSGKNAVLRGWSDSKGGLAQLCCLTKINVYIQSDSVEGSERDGCNFNTFQERLKQSANRPSGQEIEVAPLHNSPRQTPSSHIRRRQIKNENALQNHRWLKCVDEFKNFINNLPILSIQTAKGPRLSLAPIKIALIDDGIDTTHKDLQERVVGGQCFCDDESSSFYVSAGGHGTMMARLISRVFPKAQILSLKLDGHLQSDGRSHFSVKSATEAIRWATDYGVSIINMSWSIEKMGTNTDRGFKDLDSAVRDANVANILMFCSSNDQGETKDNSYPGRGPAIKIGAGTAMGAKYHYLSRDNVDFLFPGRVVEKEQDEGMADNAGAGPRNRSAEGSSLATAFASGLAGLILYMLQLTSLHYWNDGIESDKAELYTKVAKDPKLMKAVFEKLKSHAGFVEVWRAFQGAGDKVRTGGRGEARLKVMEKICEQLTLGI